MHTLFPYLQREDWLVLSQQKVSWQLERFPDFIPLAGRMRWDERIHKKHHNHKGKWEYIPDSHLSTGIVIYSTAAVMDMC